MANAPEGMGQSPWDVLSSMFEAPAPAQEPQGMPPPQAAPAAPAPGVAEGAQPRPDGLEPIIAKVLMTRAKTLTPQESQAFFNGTDVPALLVLKKMLPEIAPAIDDSIQKKQGGGAPAQPGAAPAPGPQMPPPQAGMPPQAAPLRQSGLRQF